MKFFVGVTIVSLAWFYVGWSTARSQYNALMSRALQRTCRLLREAQRTPFGWPTYFDMRDLMDQLDDEMEEMRPWSNPSARADGPDGA